MSSGFNFGTLGPGSAQRLDGVFLEHELSEIRLLLERKAGVLLQLSLDELSNRLTEYLRARGLTSPSDLIGRLQSSDTECESVLEKVLDGNTGFYRHTSVFTAFEKQVLPELYLRKSAHSTGSLRVWSAGCGTGEEAYSIAMTICEATYCHGNSNWTIHVLASDIRQEALTFAERGLYGPAALGCLAQGHLQKYFVRVGQHALVKPRLRNLVTFTQMNLARPAHLGRFDCIFCMDLLPHFSMAQRIALTQRLHLYLEPGGYLFLGESEKLHAVDVSFQPQNEGSYQFFRKPMSLSARAGHTS
jgi:chemotaxis methyl-accepting protein methylase